MGLTEIEAKLPGNARNQEESGTPNGADRAMEQENDLPYFNRRAGEERQAAGASGSRTVRNRHLEFASAYEFRVQLLREQALLGTARLRDANKVTVVTVGDRMPKVSPTLGEAHSHLQISPSRRRA